MRYAIKIRHILIGITALAIIQFGLALRGFVIINDTKDGFRFPLPDRVSAMVEILEDATPGEKAVLIRAFKDDDFDVWLENSNIEQAHEDAHDMPEVAKIIEEYVDELGEHKVYAWISTEGGRHQSKLLFERLRLWSRQPMRLAVSLDTNEWLFIESRDANFASQVFGIPSGFYAGLFGTLVGIISLITLWRGLGPLSTLSKRLEQFAIDTVPETVRPSGPEETRTITRAINRMQTDLAALIQEREAMYAGMSHDLRTYLTRFRLRIESLPDKASRAKAESELSEMTHIIENALSYAKLNSTEKRAERILIHDLISDVIRSVEYDAPARLVSENKHATVLGDASLLRRLFSNLIENSHRYAKDCTVRITQTNSAKLIVDILDRGPGIAAQDKERLLKPFERGDQARSLDIPGSGLGLAICKQIVEHHDGQMEIYDNQEGGLHVRLVLSSGDDEAR